MADVHVGQTTQTKHSIVFQVDLTLLILLHALKMAGKFPSEHY